jgi:hypothetical protein
MNHDWLKDVHPTLADRLTGADHIDVKTVETTVPMRPFLAEMLGYSPAWLRFLYMVRGGFVRLLGMRQPHMPEMSRITPADIPMEIGKKAFFFTVIAAEEEQYWLAEISESHLSACLGVVAEPVGDRVRYHVLTIVHYNRWTGPLYFNVIRPFHHVVVHQMAQAGARATRLAAAS